MRNQKRAFWKPFKLMFGVILFILGIALFSGVFGSFAAVGMAAVLPIVWIKNGKFTQELTAAEVEKLNEGDLITYIKELNESRFETYATAMTDKLKSVITEEKFNELKTMLEGINKRNADNLELRIAEFKAAAENISKQVLEENQELGNKNLTAFEINLKNAKIKKENGQAADFSTEIKSHTKGNKFAFEVKATFAGTDVSTATMHVGSQRVPGIGQIASAKLVLSNFFRVSPIQIDGNGVAVYEDWDEATTVSAAAAVAQGIALPASTAKFKTYSITIEKVGDSISMTYESIRDFQRFTNELTRFIVRNIQKVVNQALWNGTGVTPAFAGIYTRVTAFNAAGYTGATTTTPDLLDLIKVLRKQIMSGKDDKYDVNFAFVSHEDYLALELAKDNTGRLLYPLGVPMVGGVEIIPTSFVADNTMVIGDRNYVELIGDPNAVQIEVGYKTGDWESDKESVKGRVRTCLLIREADKDGFLKVTDIAAALTAITTV